MVGDRALNAPNNKRRGADDFEEELTSKERHDRWVNNWKEHFDRLNQLRSQVQPSSSSSSEPVTRRLSLTHSPVSSKGRPDGTSVELRLLGGRWLSPEPVSQDWSGWCKPRVHRPITSCASSVSVGLPCVGQGPNDVAVGEEDEQLYPGQYLDEINQEFDDILVQCYGYPNDGRQLFPPCTPLYIKFAGGGVGWGGLPLG